MRMCIRQIGSISLALTLLGVGTANAAGFEVTSTSFKDGGVIPKRHAGTAENCGSGEGLSPQVSWKNLPSEAKSVAVFFVDPDGQKGLGTSHWVAYNIPAERASLKEGEAAQGFTVGKNITGDAAYRGLCAPAGDKPHHYALTVVATTLEPGSLKPGLNRDELLAALKGHALVGQSVIGLYGQ